MRKSRSKKKKTCQKTESLSGQSVTEKMEEEAALPPAEVVQSPTPPEPIVQQGKPEEVAVPVTTSPAFRGPQCFKSQSWGHVSYNCIFSTRCVKCGLGHRASECQKTPDQLLSCANCAGALSANYRGCSQAPKRQLHRHPSRSSPKTQREVTFMRAVCRLVARGDFFTDEKQQSLRRNETATAAEKTVPALTITPNKPRFLPRVLRTSAVKPPDLPRIK